MIAVTGANGFIGANIVAALNERGRGDIVAVDGFDGGMRYLDRMKVAAFVDMSDLHKWLVAKGGDVEAVIHMGACSDTTQTDRDYMMSNNLEYTRRLWQWCTQRQLPFIYASSAATYGDGSQGYSDEVDPAIYRPLNLYGQSKHDFDLWALKQETTPLKWMGLKFFNVYGPRENHKGRMASVAFHAFHQIRDTGKMRLFESHKEGVPHGGQKRDFIYVGDAVAVVLHFLDAPPRKERNGLYNVGTGVARTFEDLAKAVFAAMGREPRIEFFPMPEDLRGKYQYFTQATAEKLRGAGFTQPFHTLETGVKAYVDWLVADHASGTSNAGT